jgi:hypothetical protein
LIALESHLYETNESYEIITELMDCELPVAPESIYKEVIFKPLSAYLDKTSLKRCSRFIKMLSRLIGLEPPSNLKGFAEYDDEAPQLHQSAEVKNVKPCAEI